MTFLALSFLAGILSVLAACVLPLLPVIVGGSLATGGSKKRMFTIILSLAASIVAFTLLLKASTTLIAIPEDFWRILSGGIIIAIGALMIFPSAWGYVPGMNALNRNSNKLLAAGYQHGGFWGDVVMGAALGPVFASCSPTYFIILATVLPAEPLLGFAYLSAYALGLSGALFVIALAGDALTRRLGVTLDPRGWFFRTLGVLLLIVGVLVLTGWMKKIETYLVERGFDATFVELKLLGSEDMKTPAREDTSFISASMKEGLYQKAPELVSPHGYLNTGGRSITLESLRGQVVLLDMWTYSCINCQRTLPYLRAWHEAYADEGLVVVGVHTPEFAFERDINNVQNAVKEFGLTYPIVLDNDYATWNAYSNRFWPRKYLIDIDGYIVYDHIGEGGYEETEEAIRRALKEKALREGEALDSMPVATPKDVVEVARGGVKSPEVYFGAWRNELLGNGEAGQEGERIFMFPKNFVLNTLYLAGAWNITHEYAESRSDARVLFRYSAKNVYMVASAPSGAILEIWIDGALTRTIEIRDYQLYTLFEGTEYGEHTLELRIKGQEFEAYTFTFG